MGGLVLGLPPEGIDHLVGGGDGDDRVVGRVVHVHGHALPHQPVGDLRLLGPALCVAAHDLGLGLALGLG